MQNFHLQRQVKIILFHLNSKLCLIPFVPWRPQGRIFVLCLFTLSAVLFPMVCSLGLFLNLSVSVLRLVQLSPLPCTKMELGLLLRRKLSMILFLFLRSSLLSSLSSKETTLSRSLWMRQVRWQCRFVSLWRQLCKLCHVISIKVDCSIIFGSPVRIVSGKNTRAIIRLYVLMKIVFTSLR